jgi:hypothetical protein
MDLEYKATSDNIHIAVSAEEAEKILDSLITNKDDTTTEFIRLLRASIRDQKAIQMNTKLIENDKALAKKILDNRIMGDKEKSDCDETIYHCSKGKDHPCPLNANDGFCTAEKCQYKVNERSN